MSENLGVRSETLRESQKCRRTYDRTVFDEPKCQFCNLGAIGQSFCCILPTMLDKLLLQVSKVLCRRLSRDAVLQITEIIYWRIMVEMRDKADEELAARGGTQRCCTIILERVCSISEGGHKLEHGSHWQS
jgi:hypothetical protein